MLLAAGQSCSSPPLKSLPVNQRSRTAAQKQPLQRGIRTLEQLSLQSSLLHQTAVRPVTAIRASQEDAVADEHRTQADRTASTSSAPDGEIVCDDSIFQIIRTPPADLPLRPAEESSRSEAAMAAKTSAGAADGWTPKVHMGGFTSLWRGLRGAVKQPQQAAAAPTSPEAQSAEQTAPIAAASAPAADADLTGAQFREAMAQGVAASAADDSPAKASAWARSAWRAWQQDKSRGRSAGGASLQADAAVLTPGVDQAESEGRQQQEEEEGGESARLAAAIRGSSSCSTCGACKQMAEAAMQGGEEGAVARKPHTRETLGKYLHQAEAKEAKRAAFMARLSDLAYAIPSLEACSPLSPLGLRLITSSATASSCLTPVTASTSPAVPIATAPMAPSPLVGPLPKPPSNADAVETVRMVDTPPAHPAPSAAAGTAAVGHASSNEAEAMQQLVDGRSAAAEIPAVAAAKAAAVAPAAESASAKAAEKPEELCPCQWYICDDDVTNTRYIIIQGSESYASWQANLSFDPTAFESPSLHVMVHRGIYLAARALYRELLPHIRAHLDSRGRSRARLQFSGHSLGGSLATLVSLMLHLRGEVAPHNVLPVWTFGSPSIMCGGERLLDMLGLPQSHIRAVMMHRDIVPRAFACEYPNSVATVLRRFSSEMRKLPCLLSQRLMYSPVGLQLILQPDEAQSPPHPLLPPGAGLYHVSHPDDPLATLSCSDLTEEAASRPGTAAKAANLLQSGAAVAGAAGAAMGAGSSESAGPSCSPAAAQLLAKRRAEVRAAALAFLNNPHPLEILADPASYGGEGSISRDHDPRNYTAATVTVAAIQLRKQSHELQMKKMVQIQQQLMLMGLHLQMQSESNPLNREAEATWYLVHGQFDWLARVQKALEGAGHGGSDLAAGPGSVLSQDLAEIQRSFSSFDAWQSSLVAQCRDAWDDAAMACHLPMPSPSSVSWRANDALLSQPPHAGDGRMAGVAVSAAGGSTWWSTLAALSLTQKAGAAVALAAALYQFLPSYSFR